MRKLHKYEYYRTRKSMNYFLGVALFANLMNFYHFGFAAMPKWYEEKSPKYRFLQIEFFVYKCKDLEKPNLKIQFIHNVISFIVGQVLQIQNILFCWAIIYLKSSEDILQNISKLDYLLKVSFF
jgi:hypothetical protein